MLLTFACGAGVDVAEETSIQPLLKALGRRHIDLLVVAAGCQTLDTIDTVTRDAVRQQFEVNAVGPLFAVKALREQLSDGAKVRYAAVRRRQIAAFYWPTAVKHRCCLRRSS